MSQLSLPSSGGDMRNTLMTMFMVKNVHGTSNSSGSDIYGMVYMMIVTGIIDLIMKYLPIILSFVQQKYMNRVNEKISSMTTDILDNTLKTKTGSVIMDIVINDAGNTTSQAILDYITNHRNTIFVSYKKQTYLLNQKEVISLEDDYYACMQEHLGNETTTSNSETQRIEIYSFIHNTTEIRKFIDKLTYTYSLTMKNKLGNQRYFFNMSPYETPCTLETAPGSTSFVKNKNLSKLPPVFEFVMKPFQTNRAFSNLFGEKMDIIRDRVKFFINNKRWYDEKGIPYTLGILLSGPPGTGKTSTIKCIANETNRHIFNINLNNDITKKQLENLFFNENVMVTSHGRIGSGQICIPLEQRIYVLEDIDCQTNLVLDREKDSSNPTSSEAIDLSFLLNILDGVLENPGRIVIMTSNYPERLDRALIRPGRIDVIAKFDYCSHKTMIDMIEFFYDKKMTDNEKKDIRNLNEYSVTPAEMSKVMFENFGDYSNMYKQLQERVNVTTNEVEGTTFLTHPAIENEVSEIPVFISSEDYEKINKDFNNHVMKEVDNLFLKEDSNNKNSGVDDNHSELDYESEFKSRIQKDLDDYENRLNQDPTYKKFKELARTSHTVNGCGNYLNQDIDGIGTLNQSSLFNSF
jgi:ATP-dependent 26S proteasome regulatory subunit